MTKKELVTAVKDFIEFLENDSIECHACWADWDNHDENCPLLKLKKIITEAE